MFVDAKFHGLADMDAYHATCGKRGDPSFVMTRSRLHDFAACPGEWVRGDDANDRRSAELDWGSLIDLVLLDEGRLADAVAVRPATYDDDKGKRKPWNNNATVCRDWNAAHCTQVIVTADKMMEATKAANLIRANETCEQILDGAYTQALVTATWVSDGVRVPVKTAIDIVPRHADHTQAILDLKTTANMPMHRWQRQVFDFWYHVQGAMNIDLWNAATGESRNLFRHIVQSSNAPYWIELRQLDDEFVRLGRAVYEHELNNYARCLDSGEWPGYDRTERVMHGWAVTEPLPWMVMQSPVAADPAPLPEWMN